MACLVIAAGNQAHIGGADLIAGKDMSLSGSSVIIDRCCSGY